VKEVYIFRILLATGSEEYSHPLGRRIMKGKEFAEIPLAEIDISNWNVRTANADENIDELAASIKKFGVLQPIVVIQKKDGRYNLIIGQRRYRASQKLGNDKIPAIIIPNQDELEVIILSFSENIHRLELDYSDKSRIASELKKRLGSYDKVAKTLGVSSQTIRNYVGYDAVSDDIKKMVTKNELSASLASRITRNIPDNQKALKIAQIISQVPRSADKRLIIEEAKLNPSEPVERLQQNAMKRRAIKVTISLTETLWNALKRACAEYESKTEDIAADAITEWLSKRGYIEQ